jgi:hypothetical protein
MYTQEQLDDAVKKALEAQAARIEELENEIARLRLVIAAIAVVERRLTRHESCAAAHRAIT